MKYDFTSIMNRKGQDAIAADLVPFPDDDGRFVMMPEEDVKTIDNLDKIPMWVADMNFPVLPTITEAVARRLSHPAFGYFNPRPEYFDEIIDWQSSRNDFQDLKPEYIGYENGVLGGVLSALNVLCSKGDSVLLHSPTYIGFTNSLKNNGYNMVLSPLKKDENNIWRMDFEDMEKRIVENNIHSMVFCSPHNPCGRVWEKWELEKMSELCEKYDVKVVSDEIWSDLIRPGFKHTPTLMATDWLRENTFAFYAPSKTFNLAGLVGSYHIIYNKTLRDRLNKESSLSHYNEMNVLSMYALLGAYQPEGHEWVDELNEVIKGNVDYACDYIDQHFDGVTVSKPQGTYMLFIDCEDWCKANNKTMDELLKAGLDCGVCWQDGRMFHGPYAIRLNLALPLSRVKEAFDRLDRYVFNADANK